MGKSLKGWILLAAILVIIPLAGWKGVEYTSTDDFCVTCHVMEPQKESAFHTIHRAPEVNCKDCHIPQDNVVRMIGYKALSGSKDIYSNVVGPPDIIRTSAMSKDIIENNCIRCHSTTVQNIATTGTPTTKGSAGGTRCFECHRSIPHGN